MNDDQKLQQKIDSRIADVVPGMIFDSISSHSHLGGDSQQIDASAIIGAPQNALTPASNGSLSTGGAFNLTAADSAILTNMQTRINQLESRLQALGLLS